MDEENRIIRRRSRFSKSFMLRRADKAIQYEYVNNFQNTSLKRCKKLDKQNSQLYNKNYKLYNSIITKMAKNNALFEIRNPPEGPRTPSNEDCFNIHQMRNKEINNKLQTIALTYLMMRSYELVIDPPRSKLDLIKRVDNKYFEPYMAVNLAKKVSSEHGEDFMQIIKEKYSIRNIHDDDFDQVRVAQRSNNGKCDSVNRRDANLDSLQYRQNIYPSLNGLTESSSPLPSAPPALPMPSNSSHMYPTHMEESNMSHKHFSPSFVNDLNNLETESVISEPPSYNGAINNFTPQRFPKKPERKRKDVNIVINNQ